MWIGFNSGGPLQDQIVQQDKGSWCGFQLAVDTFIMNQETNGTAEYPIINVRPFPTPGYIQDIFATAMTAFLGLLLTLVFIWPVTRYVKWTLIN